MRTLQTLLTILDGQKLGAGYLTPPKPTAYESVIELKKAHDPIVLLGTPITPPALLFTPAWVSSLAQGRDAIYLAGVNGQLDLSHQGPAYVFQ